MRETAENAVGLVGGRYEIVRALASGGMATVYIARHHLTKQEVALKIVASVFAQDQAGVARFLREVSVASRIQHDGVVKVFDAGFDETLRSPYLAMELLDGGSLAELLSARKVDQEGALRYVLALLDPLAAAHDAGVVHRDLKPENVFVTRDGRVKLLDFGVARDLRGSRATMEGTALGTVYYMAPEQAIDARSVGAAADVYAVGVILYQILCGIFPFDGSTPHAVLIRANRETAVPAATRAPWAHTNLTELIDRCLAKSPGDRPGDAATLRGLLAALLDDDEVVASVRGRAVNPATFLSSAPSPSLGGDFLDPFAAAAATAPPPIAAPPRPVTQVQAPEPEAIEAATPAPARAARWWWLAAAIPATLLVVLIARTLRQPTAPVSPPGAPIPTLTSAPPAPTPVTTPVTTVVTAPATPTAPPTLLQPSALPNDGDRRPVRVEGPRVARGRPVVEAQPAPPPAPPLPTPPPSQDPAPVVAAPAPTPAPAPAPPPPVVVAPPPPAVVAAPPAPPPAPRPTAAPPESPPFVTF
ncbi:MAG: serine/threonine-protein kinase [Polyangiales bacterium]